MSDKLRNFFKTGVPPAPGGATATAEDQVCRADDAPVCQEEAPQVCEAPPEQQVCVDDGSAPPATTPPQAPALKKIIVLVPSPSAPGIDAEFTATGEYADGTKKDLSYAVTWTSSDPKVITILKTGGQTKAEGKATITAKDPASGVTGSAVIEVKAPAVKKINLSSSPGALPVGDHAWFGATAEYDDGTTKNVTLDVDWSSSAPKVATVGNPGDKNEVVTLAEGKATITAKDPKSGVSGSATIEVKGALPAAPNAKAIKKIVVMVPTYPVKPGVHAGFEATAELADGTKKDVTYSVKWTSSAPNVITSDGLTKADGKATITAKDPASGVSGSAVIEVKSPVLKSIKLDPENLELVGGGSDTLVGGAPKFKATGVYADAADKDITNEVTWSSSAPKIVSIDKTGQTTVAGVGTATITAKHPSGVSASTKISSVPPAAGAKPIKVQVVIKDNALNGYQAEVEFKSPGAKPVQVGAIINGNVVDFGNLTLMPEGTLRFMAVSTGKPGPMPQGVTTYKLPASGLMTFNAVLEKKTAKVTAKTSEEAASKVGAKGTVGVEIEVISLGGEVSAEDEKKQGKEMSIEYEVTWTTDNLELSQK